VANIESQDTQVDPFNKLTIEGLKKNNFNQFDTLSIATAANNLATAEGIESAMEGENFGLFDGEMSGGIPKTLDDLVEMLDIKELSGTAVSSDIQHFSAFASDDMWPI